jgi:Kef-type K+ transport system membrane component KefB
MIEHVMDLLLLAVLVAVGAVGALVAAPQRFAVPVVVGELLLGVVIGRSGFDVVDVDRPVLRALGDLGFATVMLVAGSHVPVRDPAIRRAAAGATRVVLATVPLAAGAGVLLAWLAGTTHAPLYAVLMVSTSAALVMPVLGDRTSNGILPLMAQAAIADTVCIVALPLVADPRRALGAALGGLAVAIGATLVFGLGHLLADRRVLHPLHELSKERHLGLALRASLVLLLLLAGTAEELGTSVMLAGFSCGLVLAALGEPRRLAKQLFAVSDGFLAPVFFVRLGGTLDLRALGSHPSLLALGAGLGAGAIAVHVVAGRVTRQPLSYGVLAAAQLGVPVAAVTIGQQAHALRAGEGAAVMLGALVTIAGTAVASRYVTRAAP